MKLAQRTLALLSATGTAALMGLPVLAQAVPTQGVVNNGDINRIENQQTQTTDNCANVTGGVGGPIGEQSNPAQSAPSSYDAARTGVPNRAGSMNQSSGSMMNQSSNSMMNQSSSSMMGRSSDMSQSNSQSAPSSYDSARTGVPNTAGTNMSQMSGSTFVANANLPSPTPYNQFDALNRSAAVAYRHNGPAGTAGHEVKMNLDALQQRQRENSSPTAYNLGTPQASTQSAAPLPVACAPR